MPTGKHYQKELLNIINGSIPWLLLNTAIFDFIIVDSSDFRSSTLGCIVYLNFSESLFMSELFFHRTIPFGWNLITAGYVEQSMHGVCTSVAINSFFIVYISHFLKCLLLHMKLITCFVGGCKHSWSPFHWEAA